MTEARAQTVPSPTDWAGYGAFAGASLIWGSTFLFIAFSNEVVAPLWGATLRLAIASAGLWAMVLITRAQLPRGAQLRDVGLYGAGLGANLALLYWGQQTVPSGMTAVVFATAPLQIALYARAFGLEPIDRIKIVAAIVAVGGVAVIFSGQLDVGVPVSGLIAVFLASTTAALGSVMLKRAGRQSPWASNAIAAPVGVLICLAASVLLGEPRTLPGSVLEWLPILYLAILGSLGAFVLYAWLLGRWGATSTAFIGVIVPVIALILGAVFRDEVPPLISYLGAAVVIASVLTALARGRRAPH